MEWDEETIWRIRSLWAEGHSTAEIGRRLGVSKNAVVGKAHRLNLPARPSPIRRGMVTPPERPAVLRRVVGPTLPPLPGPVAQPPPVTTPPAPERARMIQATLPAAPVTPRPEPVCAMAESPAAVVARPSPPLRPVAAPRTSRRVSACCWPIGEPGKPSFRFCDGEAIAGKPYCTEHAQLAYVKIRDRREEAA